MILTKLPALCEILVFAIHIRVGPELLCVRSAAGGNVIQTPELGSTHVPDGSVDGSVSLLADVPQLLLACCAAASHPEGSKGECLRKAAGAF